MPEQQAIGLELFWQEAFKVLERVRQTQTDAIRRAASFLAECILNGDQPRVIKCAFRSANPTVAIDPELNAK